MNSNVVEIIFFKTKPGVSDEFLKEAAAKANLVLEKIDGFLQRHLVATENKQQWADILYWKDMNSAHQATQLFLNDDKCQDFISAVDEEQINILHFYLMNSLKNSDNIKL